MGCGIETLFRQQPLGKPCSKDQDNIILARKEMNAAVSGDRAEGKVVRGCEENIEAVICGDRNFKIIPIGTLSVLFLIVLKSNHPHQYGRAVNKWHC